MQVSEAITERRASSINRIKTLLDTRTQTLVFFSQLAGMRPYKPTQDLQMILQEFCETLIDYTASAHFQLYRFIEEGTERRANIQELAQQVYPRIAESTQTILDFNEKYESEGKCEDLSQLDRDLSHLGEILAERISCEDQIIEALSASR
jgi:regulator of sigma D